MSFSVLFLIKKKVCYKQKEHFNNIKWITPKFYEQLICDNLNEMEV